MMRRDERGAATLEFALVVPLFLLLLAGILVYGQYMTIRIAVVHAASEGARASVLGLDEAERQSSAQARVSEVMAGYDPLISVDDDNPQVDAASTSSGSGLFEVTVVYTIPDGQVLSLFGMLPGPGTKVSHTAIASYGGY